MKRIYIAVPVSSVIAADAKSERLINAGTPAAARLHATRNLFEIRVASSHEVAKLVGKGVKVEEAGEEQQTAPLPGMPQSLDVTQPDPEATRPGDEPLPRDLSFEEIEAQKRRQA